jgi:hypothetical protein
MPKPILMGSAVRPGPAEGMAASAKIKAATQPRAASPPLKLFIIAVFLPSCALLFLGSRIACYSISAQPAGDEELKFETAIDEDRSQSVHEKSSPCRPVHPRKNLGV